MIGESNCSMRKCVYFKGIKWFGEQESSEDNYCEAFPKGIPSEIAYGDNLHLTKHPDQKNDIVFEKE